MGYIFDYNDALTCEKWHSSQQNLQVKSLQGQLMLDLLNPLSCDSILDIGCGTGEILSYLVARNNFQLTGIDASPYMLDFARQKLGNRVGLHRGPAEDLPFDDNSFHHALLVNSLEFVDNPVKAIEEAARVAKDRLFIGALNRYAVQGKNKGASTILEKSMCSKAHFFSVWELKNIIRSTLGNVPLSWCTVNLMAMAQDNFIHKIEQNTLIRKLPFGSYIGMVVTLVPTYRVKPLPLKLVERNKRNMAGSPCTTAEKKQFAGEK
ncbi:MAG: class I SAM-dependent methyltransferase [Proteobacteria bacterium]|nr:class I SAM-dependent methyltransferase [Pseudomonadota bacterium]